MSDITQMTDGQLARLLEQMYQARKIAIRPVLKYRARMREIREEIKRRVTETNKEK